MEWIGWKWMYLRVWQRGCCNLLNSLGCLNSLFRYGVVKLKVANFLEAPQCLTLLIDCVQGLEQLSDYDYVAIFDADFKPEPDFLVCHGCKRNGASLTVIWERVGRI